MKDNNLSLDKLKKERAKIEKEAAERRKEAYKKEIGEAKKIDGHEKSRIALEKLQLAWVKANLTFTALGFTAYKFYYSRVHDGGHPIGRYITGRELGIFLNALAFVVLVAATFQHKQKYDVLKAKYPDVSYSIALRLSYCILAFSFLVLLLIIFRL